MAVAEIVGQERGDRFGLAGGLRRAEGLDIFQDRIFVRAGKGGERGQKSKRKCGQGELTAIDLHGFLPDFLELCAQSRSHLFVCRAGRPRRREMIFDHLCDCERRDPP